MKKIVKSPTKLILIFAAIFFLFFVFSKFRKPKEKYIQVTPKRQNIESVLALSGFIDASSKATLQFQTSGRLAWVGVKVGDRVKKYQAIASLDKTSLKKNLETQFNTYKSALSTFHDTTDDYKDKVITTEFQRILDRNQNTLNNSVITYELSDLAIKYATITSPINGIVTDVSPALPGTNIVFTTTTYTVIDPTSIYFSSEIDQEDVYKVKNEMDANVTLDSFAAENISSKISFISFNPLTSSSSTVYEIRFSLPVDNSNLKYRLGMTGNVNIPLAKAENVLTIPLDAINEENGQKYVYVKNGKNPPAGGQKKNVETGIESDTDIEIKSGLNEYDQVIIKKN
jgi:macrolide-specific efflux system membrane fusion protein